MEVNTSKIPEGFVSTFTPVLEHKIHALEGGSPDSPQQIVMIHGAIASRRYLVPTAILLAKSMRVFVPEMPGHGNSSKPKHALSVEQQAEVLFEWFQLKSLVNTNIFANSYGCQVVAYLVSQHPELASNLILTGPTCDPRARLWWQEAYRLYMDGFYEPHGAQAQFLADVWDMGAPRTIQTIQRMIENDIRPNLANIQCRTLVIRGQNDPLSPQNWSEEVAQRMTNAAFAIIPNAPHCINYATAPELTNIVLEFIYC